RGYQLPRRGRRRSIHSINDIGFRTGTRSVQSPREKGRRENAQSPISRRRSPEVCARTARFLGVSAPRPRAENVRQGRNGGEGGIRITTQAADITVFFLLGFRNPNVNPN